MVHAVGRIRIGISNGSIPGNKASFPPDFRLKSRLHYYSSIFNTIEVNSCFYKTPMRSTYEKWALDVPEDFQFTLKLSKEVTHVKDLKGDLACMEKFLSTAHGTGNKKACLLIQFPGKINLDHFEQVENILQTLDELEYADTWKKAVEFRNNSWYIGETWEMLDEFGATMVLHDIRKASMMEFKGKAGFVYIRFHGPAGDYRGSYSDSFLEEIMNEIEVWTKQGKDVYTYFNNTAGDAFNNALKLKSLVPNP